MPAPPPPPSVRIYHITHVTNLPAILAAGELRSDARMIAARAAPTTVGMSRIKQRRLSLPVDGHPGLCVGSCVPFYFCPRSVMLYILHKANDPDLSYRGGQGPIVHLEADLFASVRALAAMGRRWAFSLGNAGAYATEFRVDLAHLNEIDWTAVASRDFRDPRVKEGKQAELLAEDAFPWSLVQRIGVSSPSVASQVHGILAAASHRPQVAVEPSWYY